MARIAASRAGVTQLAECLLPKQNVAGSNPVSRSNTFKSPLFPRIQVALVGICEVDGPPFLSWLPGPREP